MSNGHQKRYLCNTCAHEFKAQGIGPHQRGTGHKGRTLIPDEEVRVTPKPLVGPALRDLAEVVLPSSMAAPDLALRLLPYRVYEDEHGKRYLVLDEEV